MKVSIDASIARLDDPTSQHRVAPVKILAFELEPRLGAMSGDSTPSRPRAPFQFEQAAPISLDHNGESHGADEAEAPAIVVTRLTAQTFETRFPPLAAQILPVQTAPMGDADRMKVSIDASIARLDDPTSQHRAAPVKILAFELKPRLGAMSGDSTPPLPRAPFQFEPAPRISLVHKDEYHGADEAETPAIVVTRLTAQSFETDFPPLVAQILPVQTAPASDADRMRVSIDASIARHDDPTSQHRVAPVKILAFELEPRSLGAMSVRMRMSASNIELQISVDSVDALRLLGSARDKLLEAIESTGVKVDSFTVRVSPMPASADDSQNAPADRSQGAMSDNSEGHRGSLIGQDGAGRERKRENQSGWPHDDGARTQADPTNPRGRDRVAGLYL
jgi:hypothetical protein